MTTEEQMRYAGAIGLLCECSVYLGNHGDANELRDSIMQAAQDWCSTSTGWTVKRVLNRIELVSP